MSSTIGATGATSVQPGVPQPAGGKSLSSGSVAEVPVGTSQIRYISPVVQLDPEAGLAVLRMRDTESGDVRVQIPAEKVVREYRSNQAAEAVTERPATAQPTAADSPDPTAGATGGSGDIPAAA